MSKVTIDIHTPACCEDIHAICDFCEDAGCDSYSPIMRRYFHRACVRHRVDNPDNNRARRAAKNLLEDLITLGEEC